MKRITIDGRAATATYLDASFNPVEESKATQVKVVFEDGEVVFMVPIPKNQKD